MFPYLTFKPAGFSKWLLINETLQGRGQCSWHNEIPTWIGK